MTVLNSVVMSLCLVCKGMTVQYVSPHGVACLRCIREARRKG